MLTFFVAHLQLQLFVSRWPAFARCHMQIAARAWLGVPARKWMLNKPGVAYLTVALAAGLLEIMRQEFGHRDDVRSIQASYDEASKAR